MAFYAKAFRFLGNERRKFPTREESEAWIESDRSHLQWHVTFGHAASPAVAGRASDSSLDPIDDDVLMETKNPSPGTATAREVPVQPQCWLTACELRRIRATSKIGRWLVYGDSFGVVQGEVCDELQPPVNGFVNVSGDNDDDAWMFEFGDDSLVHDQDDD